MSDIEKVGRYEFTGHGGAAPDPKGGLVLASDYDQLLALYQQAVNALESMKGTK